LLQASTRVPRSLAALLFVVGLVGVCWALVMPSWQGPDEIQHFSYVESLAQRHQLPGQTASDRPAPGGPGNSVQTGKTLARVFRRGHGRDPAPHPTSSAMLQALDAQNASGVTVGLAKPEQTLTADGSWRGRARGADQSDGGGAFPGSDYPPGYYLLETVGYWLAGSNATAVDHLYTARLFSVLFLLATTLGVWFFAGEVTNRHRPSQLVAAATVGLWPMLTFISSTVNPDAMLYAAWTWTFWAMARIVLRGLTAARLGALAALTATALLTKQTSVALLPAIGLVVVLGFWRLRGAGRSAWLRPALVAMVAFGLPVLLAALYSVLAQRSLLSQVTAATSGGVDNLRAFASYIWEYYLPRLPGQQAHDLTIPVIGSLPAYNVWLGTSWGAFGWVTLWFPHGLYPWFLAITLIVGAAAVARVVRYGLAWHGKAVLGRAFVPLGICFAMTAFVLIGGLHLTEYKLNGPTLQGRYLFPLAALVGTGVALATRWVPKRLQAQAVGAILALLLVFQVGSLGYVMAAYYD